ncbi:MAG: succinyl-diaminopimelate desuccinylase [Rhodospirillaceae bacterium]|nr:succinyl-diaminopimelate desuccinylase [Rhodospirillaceae bacterium]|tara:strand:- start:23 stop:1177 length:1155 start_codon:yes stop_codon:yes gene_type:complete
MTYQDIDPVKLSQSLIQCPSVTPNQAGALDLIQKILEANGFDCTRLPFKEKDTHEVDNLYACWGNGAPNLCFAGHVDVVPPGEKSLWEEDPFSGKIVNNILFGRGAADMKSAIASFISAAIKYVDEIKVNHSGTISFLITSDEEGPAINGTKKVLEWLNKNNIKIDDCIIGEPTNPNKLGEMIKIGRRGSLTGRLEVFGKEGHVAYPEIADNPISKLINIVKVLNEEKLDNGNQYFQPSNLEITTIDVDNEITNMTPLSAKAVFNIRFNDQHTSDSLKEWLNKVCIQHSENFKLDISVSGESFFSGPGKLSTIVAQSINDELGVDPELSTNGGTSDGRFIKNFSNVVEFGLIGKTMHKLNENININDINSLTNIYFKVIKKYFS